MARYYDVHPVNPQPRALGQVIDLISQGGLVACPTDSGYALCCRLGDKDPLERIKRIRQLDDHHHFTLMVSNFAQLGTWVEMDNWTFRALKAVTPGRYTFILKAGREVPKVMMHPKKKTVGVRVPTDTTMLALLDQYGEPLVTTTLILPGQTEPMADGWQVKEELDAVVDAVIDSGECGVDPTTVVDLTVSPPEIARLGAGDPEPFE